MRGNFIPDRSLVVISPLRNGLLCLSPILAQQGWLLMVGKKAHIRRPVEADWDQIMEVLETANFHHIGGPEMRSFPLSDCFVAEVGGRVVGVGGYRILDETTAKTTLLAVHPDNRGIGAGRALQQARQDYLKDRGIRRLYTNSDDQRVVDWYRRHFGYRLTGRRIAKQEPFGRHDRDEWINLVVDL